MYNHPIMYLLEFKSSKGTSFSFSEKIIHKHQIEDLKKASNYHGIIAGFVFNFRKYNETWFVHINDFCKFKDKTTKVSINRDDCKKIGLKINQTLKRTKFLYHIGTFIKESKEKYIEDKQIGNIKNTDR